MALTIPAPVGMNVRPPMSLAQMHDLDLARQGMGLRQQEMAQGERRMGLAERGMDLRERGLDFEMEQSRAALQQKRKETLHRGIASIVALPEDQWASAYSNERARIAAEDPEMANELPPVYSPQVGNSIKMLAARLGVKGAEDAKGFTLTPGAERFDAAGNRIASVPPTPEKGPEAPTKVREYEYARQNGFTGSYMDFLRESERAAKPTADQERRQQIVAQLQARGIPADEYTVNGILAGTIQMRLDPAQGRVVMTDTLQGTAREIPLSGGAAPAPAPEAGGDDVPAFPYGAEANIRGTLDRWAGVVFGDPDVASSRQAARLLREDMIAAFSRSGRPSNFAQQRVEELLPSMSNPLASAESARAELETSRREIAAEMAVAQRLADDPSRDSKARAEARAQIDAGNRALRKLDRILDAGGPKPGDVEDGYRFKGGDPSKPESWEKVR